MSSNILADRPQAKPAPEHKPSQSASLPVSTPLTEDPAAWEHLLLAEDDLADAPPIPLEAMRREAMYGD